MKKLPEITLSEWAEVMEQSKQLHAEVVPKGWKTMAKISEELRCTQAHARHQLNPLIDKTIDRKKFRIVLPTGSVRSVFHYKRK